MEIGKTFCGRTDGRTDGRTHLSSNLLGHRRGDDLKINLDLVMVALWNRADHYIFAVISVFFFSSPNLSGQRLDVYHTCTHGVALVRI